MKAYPYLWDRNGHYYFRIAVPLTLAPYFGRRELSCSLKSKCPLESKRRCLAILQVAQWLFMAVKTMPRLTPEEIQKITQNYFKEALRRLDVQLDTVEGFSKGARKIIKESAQPLSPEDTPSFVLDAKRLDFLLPHNFKHDDTTTPKTPTGMHLGFHNQFDGDSDVVTQHLIQQLSLDAEEGTLSYQSLRKGVERSFVREAHDCMCRYPLAL